MSCDELTEDLKTNREESLLKHVGVRICLCKAKNRKKYVKHVDKSLRFWKKINQVK